MRRNGTPGAFGKGRPPAPHNAHAPRCTRSKTGTWCNHDCTPCADEMARRAARRNAQTTVDLGRMMRQAPRQAAY